MSGDTAVALGDYPVQIIGWKTGFIPNLLEAIGQLAVVTADIEQTLHQIYWKHAGLNQDTGPIVTDILNPKRLSEDILKFARLDPAKANIVADLELVLEEFESLNITRNQCLHWIWERVEVETPKIPSLGIFTVPPSYSYRVKRPAYKQKGIDVKAYTVEEVEVLCNACSWVSRRLHSHAMEESELRRLRQELDGTTTILSLDANAPTRTLSDTFWPAPWLDKPLPPEKKPSDRPGKKK
jgi:hypothetical protein